MHGKNKHKHISRIDAKHNHCWFIRIAWKGDIIRKSFADTKNGGHWSALLCALAWRDNKLKEIGKPLTGRTYVSLPKSNTGYIGINENIFIERKFRAGRMKEYSYPVFEITWNPVPGKVSRTRVSINKHGREKALEIAIAKREDKLEKALTIGYSRYK